MPAISVQNLSKIYPPGFPRLKKLFGLPVKDSVEALNNVSLEIAEGEIFGLIGKNGAGKTTLTKIIATLVQPTSGKVFVKGFDSVKDEVKVRSLIGLATAEERSFYWRLNCEQNMLFFARLYGLNDRTAKSRISEIFAQVNLEELRKRRFSDLSTGNKQRLAVARALLPHPPILLLDEPTRSLDPLAAADMRKLIASLKNVSVLLTSHNLDEIEQLCSRVAVISKGAIRVSDTPKNLRQNHQPIQEVHINFAAPDISIVRTNLKKSLNEFSLDTTDQTTTLSFKRESEDKLLSKATAALNESNARILNIQTESATLLDVLESWE